jgi:hypothetical protein
MVLKMQEGAIRKAQRTIIERTLGGRTIIKTLHDYLKLHLPTSFESTTFLTRGYFKVLFVDEGAKATRKITVMEWNNLNLSFSKYVPNFDSNVQGVEALLTHSIKVQFPDLHEQFRNTKALIIIASRIGEVLEIEATDSYMKRPAGPMIIVKVRDISKLARYICIPSMAEGASTKDTITQKNLYSELPNQCRKCRRFGHLARTCNVIRTTVWDRNAATSNPASWSERITWGSIAIAPQQTPRIAPKVGGKHRT